MPLAAGSQLGVFQVLSSLGSGGMGEVYRARDTELGRDVALKVLSPSFSSDRDGLARFEREARLLAALNHHNIASIYGVVRHDTTPALVLELVPGATLAELIARGPLPVEQAVRLAGQIADALQAAHERSIVHRDLKPANIKVADDGTVKVLDFGIAKALAADSDASTIESHHTRAGVVIGTRAYMSPEQTRALPVDQRTDIWAFGCVLYEMLSGRRAFGGATDTDITTAVLEHEPDWGALPDRTPEPIRRLLRRTLAKDPRRRLRDIADARIELDEALQPSEGHVAPSRAAPRSSMWRVHAAWAATLLATLALGVWAGREPSAPAPIHVAVPLPGVYGFASPMVALSADGRRIAVAYRDGISVRDLADPRSRLLAGTSGASTPSFSPDGEWIAFHVDNRLRKVRFDGGEPATITDVSGAQRGITWLDDGTIVLGHTNAALQRVAADGGTPQPLTALDRERDETSHRWPHAIAGHGVLLYSAGPSVTANDWNTAHVVAQSLRTGERRVIVSRGSAPTYGDGYLFYLAGRSLMAQRFDPDRLAVSGPVVTVAPDVMRSASGAGWYAVSANGSLVSIRQTPPSPRTLVWSDRQGATTPLPMPPAFYGSPRLSPDGSRLVVSISDPDSNIWVYDAARGTRTQITSDGRSLWPMWTSNGANVVYTSMRGGPALLRSRSANGTGDDTILLQNTFINRAYSWTPGGDLLLMQVRATADLWVLAPGAEPRSYYASRGDDDGARVSPDGRWVAYRSTESGTSEIYVSRMPDGAGDRQQVSRNGGNLAAWSRDGRELLYRIGNDILAVSVSAAGIFGEPRRLFTSSVPITDGPDVAPDGRLLLLIQEQPPPAPTEYYLTLNAGAEIRRRAASQ